MSQQDSSALVPASMYSLQQQQQEVHESDEQPHPSHDEPIITSSTAGLPSLILMLSLIFFFLFWFSYLFIDLFLHCIGWIAAALVLVVAIFVLAPQTLSGSPEFLPFLKK